MFNTRSRVFPTRSPQRSVPFDLNLELETLSPHARTVVVEKGVNETMTLLSEWISGKMSKITLPTEEPREPAKTTPNLNPLDTLELYFKALTRYERDLRSMGEDLSSLLALFFMKDAALGQTAGEFAVALLRHADATSTWIKDGKRELRRHRLNSTDPTSAQPEEAYVRSFDAHQESGALCLKIFDLLKARHTLT